MEIFFETKNRQTEEFNDFLSETEANSKKLFIEFDKNNDGFLNYEEFFNFNIENPQYGLSNDDKDAIKTVFNEIDTDKDGKISYDGH